MDLRALEYFVAIYENGSLSAASKKKFIAQPSISASLKQLEHSLATSLFVRHARGVQATHAGEQLYPLAKQLLEQAGAIRDVFSTDTTKTPFRLGLIKGLGVARMSDLLGRFTRSVDSLELTLVSQDEPCQARIISRDLQLNNEQFVPMWQEEYQLAMPLDHRLSLIDSINIMDLQDVAFIQRSPCEGWSYLKKALNNGNIRVDTRARIQTIEYALGLVKAGLGCAFIPVSEVIVKDKYIHFKPIKDLSISREIGLGYTQMSDTVKVLQALATHHRDEEN
ncbi:LysR family transcriptional regulator [Paraglaciecola sp. MB-3u-78]|uniref:LysR family transcriptional regulator n=1 Tax=Paraglaciecola sp. MB-3u-78 TaxID=2058332 RepID=UPI000C33F9E5|nr:LysR family transcriptional regulator [Paraglaciecola sp. MB-3u-78]PKG98806.1 LysR family transcriptional regulator [Paraglaciecola sp. MB-3u-78]